MTSRIHWNFRRPAGALAVALAALLPMTAQAQWAWKESNGSTVFSDLPPPPSIPEDRIIRRPGRNAPATNPASPGGAPAAATPPAAGAPAATRSMSELAASLEKQRKERLEDERKEADAATQRQKRAADCQRLEQHRQAVADGSRVRSPSAGGVMGDAEREQEAARLDEQISTMCSGGN